MARKFQPKHHGVKTPRGLQGELWCETPGKLRTLLQRISEGNQCMHQRFGRLFPNLVPLKAETEKLKCLAELMCKEGPRRPDKDRTIPAGFTFLGQFIDHDITLDVTSSLDEEIDPAAVMNARTPVLELDSVYGRGMEEQPYLYDSDTEGRLLVGNECAKPTNTEDLPRNQQGRALIGDPRNDENGIISQLHLTFLKFHNAVHYLLEKGKLKCERYYEDNFKEAQRLVRWHYQWIVSHEYLPLIVDKSVLNSIFKDGFRIFRWDKHLFMPVEFSVAVYRFGHSQVRSKYDINDLRKNVELFRPPNSGLTSFSPVPKENVVDWKYFFDLGGFTPQQGHPIDTRIATELCDLPFIPEEPKSLPLRNLERGVTFSLPAGETVACAMGVKPLPLHPKVAKCKLHRTPLWFYVLYEAQKHKEAKLGQVGGRIVAEVLLGLIKGDPMSYISVDPCWKPCLGKKEGVFTIADLIKIAGTRI